MFSKYNAIASYLENLEYIFIVRQCSGLASKLIPLTSLFNEYVMFSYNIKWIQDTIFLFSVGKE